MRIVPLFALIAITPAALATSPAAATQVLAVSICNGDGVTRTVSLPVPHKPSRNGDDPCCMKGCHAGGNRKRIVREFDPSQ